MPHRIEVGFKPGMRDAAGEATKNRIERDLGIRVDSVRTIDAFSIADTLEQRQTDLIGNELLCDPVIQSWSSESSLAENFDWLVEVGFRPGVTDNVGRTAKEAVEDLLKTRLKGDVYYSKLYLINGKVSQADVERITKDLLANGLIESWSIIGRPGWKGILPPRIPVVDLRHKPEVRAIDINIGDKELMELSKSRVLVLNLEEMKAISDHFRKPEVIEARKEAGLTEKPTDVELEVLAQTWSEHCKHKIFNALIEYEEDGKKEKINSVFKTYIRRATEQSGKPWLVSVFKDNAGVIKFNDEWNLVMKVETHNSPSALDPYGGALTGIVGVNRDALGTGKGARLIFNTDVFCFPTPFWSKAIPERLLHPKRVFEGVRRGVEHGGNKSGIPTVNGSVVFEDRYMAKPIVYCGTGGIMPAKVNGEPSHLKPVSPGDLAVMCGGRIGKDGIHGATFSSEELQASSPATAVQIGDPITQKKMADFLLEARDEGLYVSLTDNGAGGLSSSIGEMAQTSGGCRIFLDKCPLKYAGMDPWEILLSEAQERMTVVVPPNNLKSFLDLSRRRGVESTVVGEFTNTGKFHALFGDKTVAYLDMEFLHEGVPQLKLKAKWSPAKEIEPSVPIPIDLTKTLKMLLGRLNICSKEYVVRQYDHEVQAGSVVKPLVGASNDGPSDAGIIRPILSSREGIVISHGIVPRYSDIDTYWMAAAAIDEAVRNFVSVGGDPDHMAGLDNFSWCDPVQSERNPDGEHKLAQLVRACRAIHDFTSVLGVPCISGKDSMKNDYLMGGLKISIPPTLLFTVVGKIQDTGKAVTMDAKAAGDLVYVIGTTRQELGGSEYLAMQNLKGASVPRVDSHKAMKTYHALSKAIREGVVASCHDCSDGGLGVALAESAFSGNLGMDIELSTVPKEKVDRDDYLLFSESQSRFVVTVKQQNRENFEKSMKGIPLGMVGKVTAKGFTIKGLDGSMIMNANTDELKEAWQKTLRW